MVSDETLKQWVDFVEPYLYDGEYEEVKFARSLLVHYRDRLCPPGCSSFLFDFERCEVIHKKAFLAVIYLLYSLQITGGSSHTLARIICRGFKIPYKVNSFAALLRKGVHIDHRCLQFFKKLKITKPPRK